MQHLLLKAVTTATDEGTFTAVISAASVDREKDIVDPDGMVRALHKWVATGKKIPLAWQHSGAAEDQIGWIDPASAKAVDGEVVADGFIDQSTEVGAHAWRMAKAGTLGFSFGYLIPDGGAAKRAGGGLHIKELDVFEITATPTPMHNSTRVLGWKADVPMEQLLNAMLGMAQKFIAQEDDPDDIAVMRDVLAALKKLGAAEASEPDDSAEDASKALRQRADEVALEHATGGSVPPRTRKPDGAEWLFPASELIAAKAGDLKAVWTAAYINTLPDSSFLHVESGGSKDDEGKTTPRGLRHFPYKDANGAVDLPHLRNALARIPQSDLPQNVKDELTAKAQGILDQQKSVDVTDKETKSRSVDPLRNLADAVALEYLSDGESRRKPPREKAAPKPTPQLALDELRQRTRDEMLIALTGVEEQ